MEKETPGLCLPLLVCLLAVPSAAAQDIRPPAPGRRVNIRITERFRRNRPHPRYAQPRTVHVKTPGGEVALDSRCEWLPLEEEFSFAPTPTSPPVGPLTIRVTGAPLAFDVTDGAWPDPDLLDTPYSSTTPPPPLSPSGGPPVRTASSGADGGTLFGPDLDLALGPDATDWISTDMKGHLYVRGLFGKLELVGVETGVQLYSAGVQLRGGVFSAGPFSASAHLSAGPAWLVTDDLGEARGIDAAAGLEGELRISRTVHLTAGIEAHGFWSEDLFGWGPAFLLGCNLGW